MRIFLLKSAVICVLYLVAQYFFYHNTTTEFGITAPFFYRIASDMDNIEKMDIITLGSSIEYMSHPREKNKRTMTQNLQDYLPQYEIMAFSQPAFTIDLLSPFLKYLRKKLKKDKLYIIELNWDQYSLTDNKPFLDRTPARIIYEDNIVTTLFRPLSIFNHSFGILSTKEFEEQEVYYQGEYQGTFKELYETNDQAAVARNRYMIQYLYELDDNTDKIKTLKKLIAYSKENDLEVLFYLTPFDYQSCDKYFEESVCNRILNKNIDFVVNLLESNDMPYINLSKSLPTEHIASTPALPNGHLKAEGRDFIAKELAKWMKTNYATIYPKQQVSLE